MAIAEGLRRLAGISLHKAGVRVGKAHRQEVDFTLHPADDGQRFTKINLSMARGVRQRNEHLALTLPGSKDVVLHNCDPARKAILITQPLEDPLRCVPLLLRTPFILFQNTVDNADEGIELRAHWRPRPDITRWDRITQHLPDRARINPKTTSRFSLAQPIYHYRVAHPRIQFHSLHPPPFAAIRKGLSLTEFYAGATTHSGRFSEGLLFRRSQ